MLDKNTNQPVFILGAPRSGTTFLASLLEKTEYGAPFETHFITKYYKKLSKYSDINQYANFERLLSDILKERPVMQWRLDIDKTQFYDDLGESFTYAQMVNQLCLKVAHSNGFANWGDKTPHYLNDLDILYTLFPNSKYIYIIRDGRDVALSLLKKDWGPNTIYHCAQYWSELNRHNQILTNLEKSGQLYQLQYEDLLDNVNVHVKNIFTFLDTEYPLDGQLDFSQSVVSGNYNKWEKVMTKRQIEIFESVAGETLERFGYKLVSTRRNIRFYELFAYKLYNLFLRANHLFKSNVIDFIKIKFFGMQPFND